MKDTAATDLSSQLDGRRRGKSDALDHLDRQNLRSAFAYGHAIGFMPSTVVDFHPVHMIEYPTADLAIWFKDELRNRITTWLRRRKITWYAVWTRENYAGHRREHLHLMLHCPSKFRPLLGAAIRRWYPGAPEMLSMDVMTWRKHPSGRIACPQFEYRMKQMTSKAQGPPRTGRPNREVKSRYDGSPVTSVTGLRCGVSKTLDEKARREWEEAGRPDRWIAEPRS